MTADILMAAIGGLIAALVCDVMLDVWESIRDMERKL